MSDSHQLIDLPAARRIVLDAIKPTGTTSVGLDQSLGCVLAGDIRADMDFPPFDRAMMDGYAVRTTDTATAGARLTCVGCIPAGVQANLCVHPGQAIQINTGAPVPEGADTVVPVEKTRREGDEVIIMNAPTAQWRHIARRATIARSGQTVLVAGVRMGPPQIAIAATVGAATVPVYKKPTAAILVTGDELVDPGDQPGAGQIRNSNGPMLTALFRKIGITATVLGVAPDDRVRLAELVRSGLEHDCLCISGGISMGRFDYVPEVLRDCGVDIKVRGIAIKPGKPTLFGMSDGGCCVFGLPGNPISSLVAFRLLVISALDGMQGVAHPLPIEWPAVLSGCLSATGDRTAYWPGHLTVDDAERITAQPTRWNGSGDPFGFATANALILRGAHQPATGTGDAVRVIPLDAGCLGAG